MESSLAELNPAQYGAVTSPSSVLQILAPPGSGKTKTLTSRVAYLLSYYGYKPWDILCLTFTIKSAREMKDRIAKLIGNGMEAQLVLGTFHSVCRRYLVSYGHFIGIRKGFGIADSSDSLSIIKRLVKRMDLNIEPKQAQARISGAKSRGITYTDVAKNEGKKKNVDQQQFHLVFEAYEDHLERSNMLDYDDLLLRCVDLLRQHPECVSNVEVVLIDEFQDTNLVQFDLMRLFAAKNKRVTTVGDPDQSIYGWRSAEIENLNRMQRLYPDTLVIHLEENYRSSAAIIMSAREVIEQDVSRIQRPLLPTHCPGTVPVLRKVPTAEVEASWIVAEIERCTVLTGGLLTHSDYSILLRSAALSRHIESALGRAGIPYRMVGGQRFFDRLEIKILLDYLRVISQPANNDAIARVINVPLRGIGPATIKALLEAAETANMTLWHLIRDLIQGGTVPNIKISKQASQGLGSLFRMILSAKNRVSDANDPYSPELLLRYLTVKLDFERYIKKNYEQDYDTRWANVEELFAQASDYEVHTGADLAQDSDVLPDIEGIQKLMTSPAEETLSKFLANVALATEIQREEESEDGTATPQCRVTISTMHAAKGLEWPVVFIPSAYEGSIPHSRAEDTNEERRLLYVAMTRAQALLYVSCPTKNSQREETTLSPFLSSKKVRHFFTNKGPTLGFSAVQDISRILRRQCPTQTALLESCKNATRLEDDQWPLNGGDNADERKNRWNKLPPADLTQNYAYPPMKRRRVQGDDGDNVPGSVGTTIHVFMAASYSSGISTTMSDPSAFSYAGGFTTAASQLQAIEAERALQQTKPTKAPTAFSQDKKSTKASEAHKRHKGQSTLSSFLRTEQLISEPPPSTNLATSKPPSTTAFSQTNKASPPKSVRLPKPALAPTHPKPAAKTIQPTPREPLSSIPQPLATHRLPTHRTTMRPRPLAPTADHDPKDYLFLSSSPPRPTLPSEPEQEDEMLNRTMHSSSGIRPAATYHTTSVAHVQAGSNSGRRTLGVKRSMNGWAARGNKGFAVPRSLNDGH